MITEYGERLLKEKMEDITAVGGYCAPPSPIYDLFPTFRANRGGVEYSGKRENMNTWWVGDPVECVITDANGTKMYLDVRGYTARYDMDGLEITIQTGYNNRVEVPMEEEPMENSDMRYDRFPANGGLPVAASVPGYSKIPWTDDRTTLIVIDGTYVGYAKTLEEKRNFAFQEGTILVCWPGRYSQDIFVVDDKDQFRKALGFKLASEVKRVDEQGRKWVIEK